MQPRDPHFPNLPPVLDEQYRRWTKKQKDDRHVLEIAEAAKMFSAMQDVGMDIFEAAESVPTPRLNRAGAKQSDLRSLYQGALQPPSSAAPAPIATSAAEQPSPPPCNHAIEHSAEQAEA